MKTLKITREFVSRMTVATKFLKICLSNMLIDDEIFKSGLSDLETKILQKY